ncbi:MAG: NAD(P)/FAD-dependent oxidoreductase [Ilumatobacteraceae bacterium]
MSEHRVDVVVIGMGPGGEDVAGSLAEAGLSVVGIESHLVGGECPYYGCIPSKMVIRAADLLEEGRRINEMAGSSTITPDFRVVADRIRDEATDDWDDQVAVDRFVGKGGSFVRGRGSFDGPGRVLVDGAIYVASKGIVLATGTSPSIPPIPGLKESNPWTNRDIVKIREMPESMIVLGGGPIGLEFAQAFSRFGCEVTIIEQSERILAVEEPECSELLTTVLTDESVKIHCGVAATSLSRNRHGFTVMLDDDASVTAAQLLVATGRTPNLTKIGLKTIGLDDTARPSFTVDEQMRIVGVDNVWAVGDIAGKGSFTHMAMYEAGIAFDSITGASSPRLAEDHAVSRVTFTDPEIGSVGMTEAQARKAGLRVAVGIADSSTSSRGWIHGEGNAGLIKLIADLDRGVLVGATSAGPRGGDVLSMFNLAVHARVPIAQLRSMIYAYPTFYRGALDALADLD